MTKKRLQNLLWILLILAVLFFHNSFTVTALLIVILLVIEVGPKMLKAMLKNKSEKIKRTFFDKVYERFGKKKKGDKR